MGRHSDQFRMLVRQVAKRRRDLLRIPGHALLYPALGTAWSPTEREATQCEAFLVLFVAELESYFEWVIERSLSVHERNLLASVASECGAAASFVERIKEKERVLAKNNNANWSRISELFEFVGLKKSLFPADFWDDVEHVVKERGGIVHKSLGLRVVSDPRITIAKAEIVLKKLTLFDSDVQHWLDVMEAEIKRLGQSHFAFVPGIGSLSTGAPA